MELENRSFYDRAYLEGEYAQSTIAEQHSFFPTLNSFIEDYSLANSRCLEIGCGRGAFQDLIDDYTGVDLSFSVSLYLHKPFYQCSATSLPFPDRSFDAIWTYAVLEHVLRPEAALAEIRRVLRPGGLLLLAPAWQCRSWAAAGYPVRSYSDFNWRGKLVKASIPVRDSVAFRSINVVPRRLIRLLEFLMNKRCTRFKYHSLTPNYERYWMSDSDAVNSMDPFEAIVWFVSRGDQCLSYPSWIDSLLVRTGALIFRKC